MVSRFPSTGFSDVRASLFTASELRQVLGAYSEGVLKKNWRDYAIYCDKDQTVFGVVEHGHGQPASVLYSISRTKSQKSGGGDYYRVFEGEQPLCRTDSFLEAIAVFRRCGMPNVRRKLKPVT